MTDSNFPSEATENPNAERELQQGHAAQLLEHVSRRIDALRKGRALFADQLAPDFRLFDYLRKDEYGLSRCLADLLKPDGAHGQGRLFLDGFLQQIGAGDWARTGSCRVTTEQQTDQGRRIDIALACQNGWIGIENKPWAGDQKNQLSAYADWLKKVSSHDRWMLVYLSNREPTEFSIEKEELQDISSHYVWLTYHDLNNWLQTCAEKTKALTVRVFVEELAKFIRNQVNGETEMNEQQEIKKTILESTKNLEAAYLVFKNFEKTKIQLMDGFKNQLVQKLQQISCQIQSGCEGFFQGRSGNDLIIIFNGCKQPQKANIAFGFEENNYRQFYIGIRSIDKNSLSQDEQQQIKDIMTQTFSLPSDTCDSLYLWWIYGDHTAAFGNGFIRSNDSIESWKAMLDGSLADKIFEITKKTYEAFQASNQMALLCNETDSAQQESMNCINSEDMTDETGRSLDPESGLSETNPGAEIPS